MTQRLLIVSTLIALSFQSCCAESHRFENNETSPVSRVASAQPFLAVSAAIVAGEPSHSTLSAFIRWLSIIVLLSMSSIFSGLTLGFMSLDPVGLEVVIRAGQEKTASLEEKIKSSAAKKILPIRKQGNRLLTTLILGNISVNSLLSILMADFTTGFAGFVISTALIVMFGEIIPQALCSRHALLIGARFLPLVHVLLFLFAFFAKPIAAFLNYWLGEDVGTIFTKRELEKLLEIHVKQRMISPEEGHIVRGAMGYKNKRVDSIIQPLDRLYMLPISFSIEPVLNLTTRLDVQTVRQIYQSGYSRVPVWQKDINDIIGIFFVKDLVYIDPKEKVPLLDVVHVFGRGAHQVWVDSPLGEVLKVFRMGSIHMALVFDVNNAGPGDPFYELKGLITLEDIVEEILQDKIMDETDSPDARVERSALVKRMEMDYV